MVSKEEIFMGFAWNKVFATNFEDLEFTRNGERIKKEQQLKNNAVLVYFDSIDNGRPHVAIYAIRQHDDFLPFQPDTYYDQIGKELPENCKDSLIAAWNKVVADEKKAAGKKKCEADRAARHGKKGHFQWYDDKHPYRW